MKLASGSKDIKIWDIGKSTSSFAFSTHNNPVATLQWTYDNSALLSASAGDKGFSISAGDEECLLLSLSQKDIVNCARFNHSNRFVACGLSNGNVSIWDLKNRGSRYLKGHTSPVLQVIFSMDSNHIASGSSDGRLLLQSSVSEHKMVLKTPKDGAAISGLDYSYFDPHLLAASTDDGSMYLLNTNDGHMVHNFHNIHQASCTGLVFSPSNNMLVISVGLDKSLICYDIRGCNVVHRLRQEFPFHCVDMYHDGFTISCGVSTGEVFLFDLRNFSQPITRLRHQSGSAVNVVKFHYQEEAAKQGPTIDLFKDLYTKAKSNSLPKDYSAKYPSSHETLSGAAAPITPSARRAQDAFSPLQKNTSAVSLLMDASNISYDLSSLSFISSHNQRGSHLGGGEAKSSEGMRKVSSVSLLDDNNTDDLANSSLFPSSHADKVFDGCSREQSLVASSSVSQHAKVVVGKSNPTSFSLDNRTGVCSSIDNLDTNAGHSGDGEEMNLKSSKDPQINLSDRATNEIKDFSNIGLSRIQVSFFQDLMQDCMSDMKELLRFDMMTLYGDIVRQMSLQTAEMRRLVGSLSVIPDLRQEVSRLKEENSRLRRLL